MTPRLTVAMSVYNNGPYVGAAIDSILSQTFGDFEFIIVNDGSTDQSREIIDQRARADRRIRVIHQENRGFIASLNRMFDQAAAPWVARMDGDDISHPERFARELEFLAANPDHGAVSCNCRIIDAQGLPLARPPIDRPLTHEGLVANLEGGPLLNHNAVILSREAVIKAGGYRSFFRHAEDYDLWLRLSQITRLANLPDCLVDYRVYSEQVSTAHLFEQTRNAAIAWLVHTCALNGKPDPLEGLERLPPDSELDLRFGPGSAAYLRRRIVDRILFAPETVAGEGWQTLLDYIADGNSDARLWRAALRLLRAGKPLHAVRCALALAAAGTRSTEANRKQQTPTVAFAPATPSRLQKD